jgi:hypothetical protein
MRSTNYLQYYDAERMKSVIRMSYEIIRDNKVPGELTGFGWRVGCESAVLRIEVDPVRGTTDAGFFVDGAAAPSS